MRCLEALGRWSELEEAGCNALVLDDEQSTTSGAVGWHPCGNITTTNLLRSELNLTINETEKQQKIAQMAARASCVLGYKLLKKILIIKIKIIFCFLGDYEKMEKYVQLINQNTQEGAFLRAVIAIKKNQFKDAFGYIHKVFFKNYIHFCFFNTLIKI